jgi:hypothetical protein
VISCAICSGALHFAMVVVCDREVDLEVGPGFVERWFSLPLATGFRKYSGLEHQIVGIVHHLFVGERGPASFCKIDGVIYLCDELFEWLRGAPCIFKTILVFFEIMCCDPTVGVEEVREQFQSCALRVSGVAMF